MLGMVVPTAAPDNLCIAARPAGGICRRIPVPYPLSGIAVHIVQAVGIGGILIHFHSPSQIGIGTVHPIPAGIVVVAVGVVAIGVAVVNIVAKAERCGGIGTGGVLPLRLGRQAVSVGGFVPGDSCTGDRVAGRQALGLTEFVAILDGIIPCDVRHRQIIPLVFDKLERATPDFHQRFKSITTDNGSEFLEYDKLVESIHGGKRFEVYYCHLYAAWEKGTNENHNRMIRRWYPKGTDFRRVPMRQVADLEQWMNSYR